MEGGLGALSFPIEIQIECDAQVFGEFALGDWYVVDQDIEASPVVEFMRLLEEGGQD